jgi:preprotein translocase subunit SecD
VAPPTPTPRPGRPLAVLALILVALYGWILISGNHTPKLGIDLAGGTSLTLKPVIAPGEHGSITDTAVDQAVNIIRQRVDGIGVAEASVTRQGSGADSTIVVEVPGKNENLYSKIGETAKMSFRTVLLSGAPAPAAATTTPSPTPTPSASAKPKNTAAARSTAKAAAHASASATATATPSPSPSATSSSSTKTPSITAADQAAFDALDCTKAIPVNKRPQDNATQNLVTCAADGSEKYILGPQVIPGSDVTSSSANLNTGSNGNGIPTWEVLLNFNGAGSSEFATITKQLVAQTSGTDANRFAVVLDGLVETAPDVQSAILGGQASITGNFDQSSATALANVLNYGALPLAFVQQQQQSISATLGSDDLFAGVIAGLLGLALVVVYSLLYYRGLGLVTVASLTIAGLLTYGSLVLLGQVIGYTLSLAGIAGAIVSIGITADSFVVLFERVRDEMRDGRTMRVAVEAGWTRARRTILAADAVSLIAAVTLYLLAVGNVQGFAFTLGLTTIIDVVVVFLFTKPMLTILARTKFFGEGNKWSGVDPERLGRRPATRPAPRAAVATRRAEPKEA